MDTETHLPARHATIATATSRTLLGCLAAVAAIVVPGDAPTARLAVGSSPTPAAAADVVADEAGGTAARLHDADGAPIDMAALLDEIPRLYRARAFADSSAGPSAQAVTRMRSTSSGQNARIVIDEPSLITRLGKTSMGCS